MTATELLAGRFVSVGNRFTSKEATASTEGSHEDLHQGKPVPERRDCWRKPCLQSKRARRGLRRRFNKLNSVGVSRPLPDDEIDDGNDALLQSLQSALFNVGAELSTSPKYEKDIGVRSYPTLT